MRVSKRFFTSEQIRAIVEECEHGIDIVELCQKYSIDEQTLKQWQGGGAFSATEDLRLQSLQDENRNLKQIVAELMLALRAVSHYRSRADEPAIQSSISPTLLSLSGEIGSVQRPKESCNTLTGSPEERAIRSAESVMLERHDEARSQGPDPSHSTVSSFLNRSRIIPAIRNSDYIDLAIASPTLIVWLLFGNPLTLSDITRRLRTAGKLPVANLDLMTGFAQDSDAVKLLVQLGVAGVVSTRQSVLRAARAQGIIAVQRTFVVDSIALGNITRSLQHFVPDAMELLPAAAAPQAIPALHATLSPLPIIAPGLVTTMRQVEDLVQRGAASVATSDSSLWIL
jgi:glycerol uptake operon antiterminator